MESEDQKAQDARVEKLWKILDTKSEGQLNLNGLKEGLGKIDHRSHTPLHVSQPSDDQASPQECGLFTTGCYESCRRQR